MRRLVTLLALTALVATGCTAADPVTTAPSATPSGTGASPSALASPSASDVVDVVSGPSEGRRMLRPFDSCDALRSFYVEEATELVGPYGLGFGVRMATDEAMAEEGDEADMAMAETARAAPTPAGGGDVSGTNVQEEGVDEPDIVKTDGSIIVTALDGKVSIVDVAAEDVASTVPLPDEAYDAELLLNDDDLLILSTGGFGGPMPVDRVMAFPPARTTVTRVDVSDPAAPEVLGSIRMEGTYRSARMIDGTVRLVMLSDPSGLTFSQPTDGGLTAEQEALEANKAILAESDVDDWIPHLQVIDADGNAGEVQRLMDCTQVNRPQEFAGLSTLSVVTFDLTGEVLEPTSSAGLVASGDTIYASTDRLIVATSPWGRWITPFLDRLPRPDRNDLVTDLHSFDISDPSATSYVASGSVAGSLIGQFALSETAGVIRVATTTGADWFGFSEADSQSSLIMLAEEGEELVETGRLDGLGVTEQIQSVRYLSPEVAAVVTFRRTDPLYLIDTSDPAEPALLGELKIPGFSSYLHPIGEGYLLGVGQDADEETGRQLGLQVSLFDIRDMANPERVAQVGFGEGYSMVESDHRAFLYWPPTNQVIIPAELWPSGDELLQTESPSGEMVEVFGPMFNGALVLKVGEGTLTEDGRASVAREDRMDFAPNVMRSMVIGEDLWTLSYGGLAKFSLETLEGEARIPLS